MSQFHFRRSSTAAALSLAILLSACGGGGDSGGTANPPPAPGGGTASSVNITATNARPITADALSVTGTETAQIGAGLVTGVHVDAGGGRSGALQAALTVQSVIGILPASASLVTGAEINETANCPQGGTLTVRGTVASDSGVTAGDNISVTAANCRTTVEGQATTLNGGFALNVTSGSYNTDAPRYPSRVVMTLTANNLAMTDSSGTTTATGALTIDLSLASASSRTMVLTGTSFGSSFRNAAGTTRSTTMKNFNQTVILQGTTSSQTLTATVESTNTRVSTSTFTYQVSTPTSLVTQSGAFTSGSLKVTGANNSSATLTVTSSNTFTLAVDANGDGTAESSSTVTRAELEALL